MLEAPVVTTARNRAQYVRTLLMVIGLCWLSLTAVGCQRDKAFSLPSEYRGELLTKNTKRVYLVREGSSDTDEHVGWVSFVVKEANSGEEETITYAIDDNMNDIGFYINESGATYLYDKNGEPVVQGNLEWPRALEVFYGLGEIYRVVDRI